jgi:hypothetical protein
MKKLLVPVVLAAGALLLTACDLGGSAGASEEGSVTVSVGASDDIEPVDCGPVDVADGITHTLVADPSDAGLVGCTEAFNVVDEYLMIPASERGANLEGIDLSDGWSCTTDDGETASTGCVKGRTADGYELAFHTEPAGR